MDPVSRSRRIRSQFCALLSCMFSMMSAGNIIGWMSPALVWLTSEKPPFPVSSKDVLWMPSLLYIGLIIGPIIFAFITDKIGRKWINFFAAAIYLLGWALCVLATSVGHILASRCILGIGVGFALCIVPVYVGEVIENHLRGAFTAVLIAMFLLGFIYIYILAAFVNFLILNIISLLFPLATLFTFFLMPESPHYLVMNNKFDKAEQNLMRLRGENDRINIIEELADIVDFLEDGFSRQPIGKKFKLLQLRKSAFSLMIITVLIFTQCFSGVLTVLGNFHLVIMDKDPETNEYLGIILATSIGFIVSLWPMFFIDRFGRRTLFLISSVGCIISTTLIGIYYYLIQYEYQGDSYAWLPIVGVFGFQFFFYAGLGCVPYIIASEIFPAFVRPWTTAFMVMLLGIFVFMATKSYYLLGENFGYHVSFWTFSGALTIGTLFIFVYMPETKQKSFAEIQEAFQSKIIVQTKTEIPKNVPSNC